MPVLPIKPRKVDHPAAAVAPSPLSPARQALADHHAVMAVHETSLDNAMRRSERLYDLMAEVEPAKARVDALRRAHADAVAAWAIEGTGPRPSADTPEMAAAEALLRTAQANADSAKAAAVAVDGDVTALTALGAQHNATLSQLVGDVLMECAAVHGGKYAEAVTLAASCAQTLEAINGTLKRLGYRTMALEPDQMNPGRMHQVPKTGIDAPWPASRVRAGHVDGPLFNLPALTALDVGEIGTRAGSDAAAAAWSDLAQRLATNPNATL
ncbi:hypothetical protein [Nitrospirillum iridis]|uniref:Uncharacterized protein n=1 Tax=Nitrospirillum iridis TaxID=765888 RepID=A0A7X0B1S7_9PROT|nr:hypothetical protein [Nitrospirillum iridis]MBB6254105.1 hypothetical protein [Nitrospirillum iridis]